MNADLFRILTRIIEKKELGSLILGRGKKQRMFFIADDELHLVEAGRECRFVPSRILFQQDLLTRSQLDRLVHDVRARRTSAAEMLAEQNLLDNADSLAQLYQGEVIEEMLYELWRAGNHFSYKAGEVPEEALDPSANTRSGIPAPLLLEAVQKRVESVKEVRQFFPSGDELPVLTEKGIRAGQDGRHWIFGHVSQLVDGFRTIRKIQIDSPFFPHQTLLVLAAGLRQGWIKKTVFPELKAVAIPELTPEQALALVPRFEAAAEAAADDLEIRTWLADLHQRAGNFSGAAQQLELVGDSWRAKGEIPVALNHYRKGLEKDPSSNRLKRKVKELLVSSAEVYFESGQRAEGRSLLEEAIESDSGDLDLYLLLLESYGEGETLTQPVARLVQMMIRGGHPELPNALFSRVLKVFPDAHDIRKRYVNYLLDLNEIEQAVAQLRHLAARKLQLGRPDEAQEIYDKIERLLPSGKRPKRRRRRTDSRRRRRRRLPRAAILVFGLALGALEGYQLHVYEDYDRLNQRAFAVLAQPVPAIGTDEYREAQSEAEELAREIQAFHQSRIFSAWGLVDRQVQRNVEGRVAFLDKNVMVQLNLMGDQAAEAETRGQFEKARQTYRTIYGKARGTLWRERALIALEEIDRYEEEAEDLRRRGRRAFEAGDYEEAFDAIFTVLQEYPRSPAAKGLRLPVRLITDPPGATAYIQDEPVGVTPVVLEVSVDEAPEVRLTRPGYETVSIPLEDIFDFELFVPLRRE